MAGRQHDFSSRLEEFTGSNWSSWFGRLQFFFEANDVTDPVKQRAHLLTLCGAHIYDVVCALLQPKTPDRVSYAEIVAALQAHYDPRPSEVYSRAMFQRRDQLPGESVNDYVAALRKLATSCNFGTLPTATAPPATQAGGAASTQQGATDCNPTLLPLDVMLRDRFVCGLRDENLQQRLFAEKELTFTKAYDFAIRAESAVQQQQKIKTDHAEVNKAAAHASDSATNSKAHSQGQRCWRCDGSHSPKTCKFIKTTCNYCRKQGHIVKACISRKKAEKKTYQRSISLGTSQTANVTEQTKPDVSTLHDLCTVADGFNTPKFTLKLTVHGKPVTFEVDSGAACTMVSRDTFQTVWPTHAPTLQQDDIHLRTWSGQQLQVIGTATVNVVHKNATCQLPLLVVQGTGCSLLGRNWFDKLGIELHGIHQTTDEGILTKLLRKYDDVFCEDTTGHTGPPVNLELKEGASPKFFKARPVPFAMRASSEAQIDKYVEDGIWEPVQHSDWATPLVWVRKKDGSLRACGDYRCTVNEAAKKTSYPLPTTEEVFSTLKGGQVFSTLDLAQAYTQLHVSPETAQILTVNTTKGLYKVNRLPFGVSAAPAIFQRFMETTLSGLPGVCVYLDDIIVSGATAKEHKDRLAAVLERLAQANLRLCKSKCQFGVAEVKFLGHKIDAAGIHTSDDKVEAIVKAPAPTSKQTLQSFLGMLAFYDRFLERRATVASTLYELLAKDKTWKWEQRHQKAFDELKQCLLSRTVLAHYDESKPLLISCDASPYGVGAVLAQLDSQGREAPIAFASRTLGSAERNYAQLDREGLAVVFAATHFHKYIVGREVTFLTDHQPLLGILGPRKPVPEMLSPRMKRWCLKLSAYNYNLQYRAGSRHQNADALSRLPLPDRIEEPHPPGDILMFEALPRPPLTADVVSTLTQEDPILAEVFSAVQNGTVQRLQGDRFTPYRRRATELAIHRGCISWGSRVVIPAAAREQAMSLVHAGHRGIVAMKACARSYLWWPGLDAEIETTVKSCKQCQRTQSDPKKAPVPIWTQPTTPWHTLHVDFAGPVEGHTFLVVVDAFTKWLEVRPVNSPTSTAVISVLRSLFATFGIPRKVVSDNGTAFVSSEIQGFYKRNGIRSVTSAPYHPATNGQAERYVGELKRALAREPSGSLNVRLSRFLFRQHTTVHQSTGITPAKAMFGRELPSQLDLVNASEGQEMTQAELPQSRTLVEGEAVWVRQFSKASRGPDWTEGTLVKRMGHRSWLVQCAGRTVRRHLNQLRKRAGEVTLDRQASATLTWGMDSNPTGNTLAKPSSRQPESGTPKRPARIRRQPTWYKASF